MYVCMCVCAHVHVCKLLFLTSAGGLVHCTGIQSACEASLSDPSGCRRSRWKGHHLQVSDSGERAGKRGEGRGEREGKRGEGRGERGEGRGKEEMRENEWAK